MHCKKMKFSIKDFFSKCDQIRRKLRIWSHLLKKSLMENFIFCAVMSGVVVAKGHAYLNKPADFSFYFSFYPSRPKRFKTFCGNEINVNFYSCISLWYLKKGFMKASTALLKPLWWAKKKCQSKYLR